MRVIFILFQRSLAINFTDPRVRTNADFIGFYVHDAMQHKCTRLTPLTDHDANGGDGMPSYI